MSDLRPIVRDRTILDGRRFLVIDDHGYMLDVVAEILKHFGADDTARAGTVSDALDCVGQRAN